jgi:DinB superfamily
LLAEASPRIASATKGVSAAHLQAVPPGDEWSLNDVLAHMRSCADVWGDSIRRILDEDDPTIRAINPRRWIKDTNYPDLTFGPSFRAFAKQRDGLLKALHSLPARAWSRGATVTGAGKPLRLTVHHYVERLAVHERAHVKQIERMVRT